MPNPSNTSLHRRNCSNIRSLFYSRTIMLMCNEARNRLMVACVQCNLYMLFKQLFETAKQVFAEINKGTRIKSPGEHNDNSIRIKRQAIKERTSHACPSLNSTCLPAFNPHNKNTIKVCPDSIKVPALNPPSTLQKYQNQMTSNTRKQT